MDPPLVRLVADLPATVPFVGPEALERRTGRPFQLRLGANESLFGPSPQAAEAMRAAVEQVALYGDPENAALRSELARAHSVAVENVRRCRTRGSAVSIAGMASGGAKSTYASSRSRRQSEGRRSTKMRRSRAVCQVPLGLSGLAR